MDADFLRGVVEGLSADPPHLDCRFLYDDEGTRLFDAICGLPEYYLTRAEAWILAHHAGDIRDRVGDATLCELGGGLSIKTRLLLDAWPAPRRFVAVDVSDGALRQAEGLLTARYPDLRFRALHGTWAQVFPLLGDLSPVLVLFLGSTIGNLDPAQTSAFLTDLSAALRPGDHLLLGTDLVKDPRILHDAYNDRAGVTATFTLNVFARMNRELGTAWDLGALEHQARWSPAREQVEIDAVFVRDQRVVLPGLDRTFRAGERVRVEISRKFRPQVMREELAAHGLPVVETFTDDRGWFALHLARREVTWTGL